jgi:hypothetical protein
MPPPAFAPPLLAASTVLFAPEFDEQPNAVIAAKANPTHGRRVKVTRLMSFLLADGPVLGSELGDLGAELRAGGGSLPCGGSREDS